jgi:hypothetical protein
MVSVVSLRAVVATLVLGLVAALALAGDHDAAAKQPKRLKLGKEGSYVKVFKNRPGLWQDDTSVQIWTNKRKVIAVWAALAFKLDGGGFCAPIGTTGALMPDDSLTGSVSLQMKLKKPVALTARNTFTLSQAALKPFTGNGGGSVKGKLLPSGRLNVRVKLVQTANSFQGRCSSTLNAPKAKFRAMDTDWLLTSG